MRRLAVLGAALAASAAAAPASADPQVGTQLTVGGGDVSLGGHMLPALHLGARGDVLFLRNRDGAMGIGPFAAIGSEAFRSISLEGGIDWLVPAPSSDFPFTFAAGAYERWDEAGARQGVLGEVLWGSRGYNYDGHYNLAFSLFVEARSALGNAREEDVIGGVAIDLSILGYPFLMAYEAIAH